MTRKLPPSTLHFGYVIVASLLALLHGSELSQAETLVTGISNNIISIESNFTGADLVLFGSIERDSQTVARRQGYDIIVILRGPQQAITVRRKERIAGIWVNRRSWTFENAHGFLAVLSNRALTEITSQSTLEQLAIGLVQQNFTARNIDATFNNTQRLEFSAALLEQMQARELYVQNEDGVEFLSKALFTARIAFPAYVPVGAFEADIMLFGDGALLARQTVQLGVHKSGFEQFTYALATEQPLVYGIAAVVLAVLAGWLASVMFKRD